MIHTFKATHCGIAYHGADGARDLTEHMATMHDLKPLVPGWDVRGMVNPQRYHAPGWANGRIQTPIKWAAPKTPKDWRANLARIVAANDDVELVELGEDDAA